MGNFHGWSTSGKKKTKTDKNGLPLPTANGITAAVIRTVNMQPKCSAYRINNVGVYDEKIKMHRRANTQKGIFDIHCTIRGRSCWFEVKAPGDKPSKEQLIFQQEIRLSGGIAEFITSTDHFLKLFTQILDQCLTLPTIVLGEN